MSKETSIVVSTEGKHQIFLSSVFLALMATFFAIAKIYEFTTIDVGQIQRQALAFTV